MTQTFYAHMNNKKIKIKSHGKQQIKKKLYEYLLIPKTSSNKQRNSILLEEITLTSFMCILV
jgi:hypothetical protein